jgi:hypothetical protein
MNIFRGINAAASLKLVIDAQKAVIVVIFRGINAAASLKRGAPAAALEQQQVELAPFEATPKRLLIRKSLGR